MTTRGAQFIKLKSGRTAQLHGLTRVGPNSWVLGVPAAWAAQTATMNDKKFVEYELSGNKITITILDAAEMPSNHDEAPATPEAQELVAATTDAQEPVTATA